MDCSPPGSSVHEISQARILGWVAISLSRGSSQPRDRTQVSYTAGRFFTDWATREAQQSKDTSNYGRGHRHDTTLLTFLWKLKYLRSHEQKCIFFYCALKSILVGTTEQPFYCWKRTEELRRAWFRTEIKMAAWNATPWGQFPPTAIKALDWRYRSKTEEEQLFLPQERRERNHIFSTFYIISIIYLSFNSHNTIMT